jgi:hypothetical protein
VATLFERLAQGRPPQEPTPLPTPLAAGRLLDWLQNTWDKPTICARDIYRHGPRPVREDRERALEIAEILVRRGWLTPVEAHRHDRKVWRIAVEPLT